MRLWMMLGVGALMLVWVVLPSGAWGASFEDLQAEMGQMPPSPRGKYVMRVPMIFSGVSGVLLTDVCVSGGMVRRKGVDGPGAEMTKVADGNQYMIIVHAVNPIGDQTFADCRPVSLPECK